MIYLVRHGQTQFNVERRMQGSLDSPLTELGHRQAQAVAALLAREIPDAAGWRLISSPQPRARITAGYIGEALGLPIELEPRIRELATGGFEGRFRDEIIAGLPEALRPEWAFHGPGGESYEDLVQRLQSWVDDLPPEPERKVIAVCHGLSGRVLRGRFLALPREGLIDLEAPQDAIHRLLDGVVTRLDC